VLGLPPSGSRPRSIGWNESGFVVFTGARYAFNGQLLPRDRERMHSGGGSARLRERYIAALAGRDEIDAQLLRARLLAPSRTVKPSTPPAGGGAGAGARRAAHGGRGGTDSGARGGSGGRSDSRSWSRCASSSTPGSARQPNDLSGWSRCLADAWARGGRLTCDEAFLPRCHLLLATCVLPGEPFERRSRRLHLAFRAAVPRSIGSLTRCGRTRVSRDRRNRQRRRSTTRATAGERQTSIVRVDSSGRDSRALHAARPTSGSS